MKLVIVESPGKIKKIQSYLGDNYHVEASFGHIRDLDPNGLSVDLDNNFNPTYVISPDKSKIVDKLESISNKAEETILAADQDREGEAIAYSLKEVLKLKNPPRIIFTEITKTAIEKAILNPSHINQHEVYAQQARRILDRIVGYQLSPLLWKHLPGTKSAGRVQSVLVRIIVEQERKIRETQSEMRVKVYGEFLKGKKKINTTLYYKDKIKEFENLDIPEQLFKLLTNKDNFYVDKIITSQVNKNPPPPFITSSLQQEASIRLKFPTKMTMSVAQKLYEKGLITYMRTDSTVLSSAALGMLKKFIIENYGDNYYQGRNYTKNKKNAQEAHEAIRPTKLNVDTSKLKLEEKKLFNLILNRTLASQMASAIITNQKIYIKTNNIKWNKYDFQTIVNHIKFEGYLKVYHNQEEDEKIIKLQEKEQVDLNQLTTTEDYKEPPKRLNEASLVNYLEKKGIGRPSTYSSLISKVLDRKYVEIKSIPGVKQKINFVQLNKNFVLDRGSKQIAVGSEKHKLIPTELGFKSNDFLMKYFNNILEENFTAHLENSLDKISHNKLCWIDLLSDFYQNLKPIIQSLNNLKIERKDDIDELLGEINKIKIYYGKSQYGFYVKKQENKKWKFSSVESKPTLEEAFKKLEFPKVLGKKGNTVVTLFIGKFGPYIKYGSLNCSIPSDVNINKLTLEDSFKYLEGKGNKNILKSIMHNNKLILIKKGPYGNYLQTTFKSKKINLKLGEKIPEDNEIIEMINKYK
ncbi:putative DNA topoisomerase IA [Cafeteria roenbergensis virus]|uniref:DNA topoisomerase n=1 Tax=Cafeteria roenbergensis virus (strain BV-PW1) TaxID=693272 RepID=E3T4K4_CROVB|nr:putative DNA topoisomerase IA [Cafeteria roenbergensis virus BV-PW1]ADO67117.1 putative DNA topoisomerase IA [Cafeteria roenbergensis virus BV-PW1]